MAARETDAVALRVEQSGGVATIVIDNPRRRDALNHCFDGFVSSSERKTAAEGWAIQALFEDVVHRQPELRLESHIS